MEYVNIMQAARRCQVSDKTIRRWIHTGKLRAGFPQPNQCVIAVSDLEPFLPGHGSGHAEEPLQQRIAVLEQRVQQLECLIHELRSRPIPSRQRGGSKARERTTGLLPRHLVSVETVASRHQIPEQKVRTAIEISLLPVHQGEWIDHNGVPVTMAFDRSGQRAFYQVYHDLPLFASCQQCPHERAWTDV